MSDNYLKRMADEDALRSLLQRIEDLEQQVLALNSLEQQGLYLPWQERQDNPVLAAAPPPGNVLGDFAMTKNWGGLLGFGCTAYVGGTNNTTNYWTVNLHEHGTGVIIAAVDTRNNGPNNFYKYFTKTIINAPVSATMSGLYITVVKTGSPGDMYLTPYCVVL